MAEDESIPFTADLSRPQAGKALTTSDFDMIMEAVRRRTENFPGENPVMSLALVMFNIGDRYSQVTCVGEEAWTALKCEVAQQPGKRVPMCPQGHVLTQDYGLSLGWVYTTQE